MIQRRYLWARALAFIVLLLCGPTLLASPLPAQDLQDSARQILVVFRLPPDHARASGGYEGGNTYGDDLAHSARLHFATRIAHAHGLKLVDDWPMPLLGMGCLVMAMPDGASLEKAAADVAKDRGVVFAEAAHVFAARNAPSVKADPLLPAQATSRQWRLESLHQIATGRGVIVAVIDSAIDLNHPDLAGQVALERNFVPASATFPERHGTAVAGIIAAKEGNGIGIVGVAPAARLISLRACRETSGSPELPTLCDSVSLAKAIYFAIDHHARIINLSLAGPDDRLLSLLLQLAMARGSTVVASFSPGLPGGGFPASLHGVIAVSDQPPALSNTRTVYYAPGRDVLTTLPNGRWGLVSGSSFSAAHVSGLLALLQENTGAGGTFTLIRARGEGEQIDACATLLRGRPDCHCLCGAQQSVARAP